MRTRVIIKTINFRYPTGFPHTAEYTKTGPLTVDGLTKLLMIGNLNDCVDDVQIITTEEK